MFATIFFLSYNLRSMAIANKVLKLKIKKKNPKPKQHWKG